MLRHPLLALALLSLAACATTDTVSTEAPAPPPPHREPRVAAPQPDPTGEAYYHYSTAQLAAQTGNFRDAISAIQEAIKRDSTSAFLWMQLAQWLAKRGWRPQQVQCFIPLPGTTAAAMYYAGIDSHGKPIPVARSDAQRMRMHYALTGAGQPGDRPRPRRPVRGIRGRNDQT